MVRDERSIRVFDEPRTSTRTHAWLLFAGVVVVWGANWPIMKVGLSYMQPLTFALARVVLGAASLFALLAVLGRLRLPPKHDMPIVLTVGFLQIGLFLGATHYALLLVPAGRSAILAYTTPLWVMPLATVFLKEPITRIRALALSFGIAGIAVMFNPLALNYHDHRAMVANGLLMFGAFVWAIAIVHTRGHRWQSTPLDLLPWQMLIGAIPLLVGMLLFEQPLHSVHWSPALALVLAYNGPIASAFCFWAFLTVARALAATTTAMVSLAVPVAGVFASHFALAEPLSITNVGGLTLIGIGLTLLAGERVEKQSDGGPDAALRRSR